MRPEEYVKSSPYFFRRIKLALVLVVAALLGLAALFPAPLQVPADISRVPNPSKSAWFLLWMQELVSYSGTLIYLILALGLFFFLLPFLPGSEASTRARWFPRDQMAVNLLTLAAFVAIVLLTGVALFFRGENWAFVLPF